MYTCITDDVVRWALAYQGPLFHALLCDAPYHLTEQTNRFGKPNAKLPTDGVYRRSARGFLGQAWDGGDLAFRPDTWAALGRVLLPGAFGFAFAGSRGWHRMATAIEDAGFVIHPAIWATTWVHLWVNGSGFPKATRIDNQLDQAAGAFPREIGRRRHVPKFDAAGFDYREKQNGFNRRDRVDFAQTAAATQEAQAFVGHRYGLQALRPVVEPVIVFQKPYDQVPARRVHAVTGWDHWHTSRPIRNTPTVRLAIWNETGQRIPDASADLDLYYQQRKALHPGVPSDARYITMPRRRWRHDQNEPTVHARFHVTPFRDWHLDSPAACMLVTGAGALNIDQARIPTGGEQTHATRGALHGVVGSHFGFAAACDPISFHPGGRWPANLMLSHHPACRPRPVPLTRRMADYRRVSQNATPGATTPAWTCHPDCPVAQLDTGASGPVRRYFYQADWQLERLEDTYPLTYSAKAQSREREAGLDDQPRQTVNDGRQTPIDNPFQRGETKRRNTHPTVKPLKMTTHLATLALPPERYAPRRLLVPFSGSGSEMIGALLAGWESVTGIEQDPTYRAIAERRLAAWHQVMEKLGVRDPQTLLARWDEAQRLIETGQMTMFDLFDLHDQREAS